MSKVAHFRHFQTVRYNHVIEQKANDSWWVSRQDIGFDGNALPFSRVVLFARSEQEAICWIDAQSPSGVEQESSLALTA